MVIETKNLFILNTVKICSLLRAWNITCKNKNLKKLRNNYKMKIKKQFNCNYLILINNKIKNYTEYQIRI
jgi:hypothetical protein